MAVLRAAVGPRSGLLMRLRIGAALVIVFALISSIFIYFSLSSRGMSQASRKSRPTVFETATSSSKPFIDLYFNQLQKPSVLPTTYRYRTFGALEWLLPQQLQWTSALGRDLCIIDFDDRPFNSSGEIFGPHFMSWENPDAVHGLSLGFLNHWLYSKIHGYSYNYVAVNPFSDRRTSWKKPGVIAKLLEKHKACIYIDSDAIFRNLDLPFEWLMNYWGLGPASNSLALALDPMHEANQDEFGKEYLNTGFLIAQNNPKTFEIMDAWDSCPNVGGRYPGCTRFRTNHPGRPTDQGGFGTYVRYDFSDDIRELPCNEANGFAEAHAGCDGTFIRHVWTGKDGLLKVFAGEQMPGPFLEYFHREFVATLPSFYLTESELMKT